MSKKIKDPRLTRLMDGAPQWAKFICVLLIAAIPDEALEAAITSFEAKSPDWRQVVLPGRRLLHFNGKTRAQILREVGEDGLKTVDAAFKVHGIDLADGKLPLSYLLRHRSQPEISDADMGPKPPMVPPFSKPPEKPKDPKPPAKKKDDKKPDADKKGDAKKKDDKPGDDNDQQGPPAGDDPDPIVINEVRLSQVAGRPAVDLLKDPALDGLTPKQAEELAAMAPVKAAQA